MSSHCTNLAAHAPRLREAQRAFWLAWKGVEAGDRGALQEARRAHDELVECRFNALQAISTTWNPDKSYPIERKTSYRLVQRIPRDKFFNSQPRWRAEVSSGGALMAHDRDLTYWRRVKDGAYEPAEWRQMDQGQDIISVQSLGGDVFLLTHQRQPPSIWRVQDGGLVRVQDAIHARRGSATVRPLSDDRFCLYDYWTEPTVFCRRGYRSYERTTPVSLSLFDFIGNPSDQFSVIPQDIAMVYSSFHGKVDVIQCPASGEVRHLGTLQVPRGNAVEILPDGRVFSCSNDGLRVLSMALDEEGGQQTLAQWQLEPKAYPLLRQFSMIDAHRILVVMGQDAVGIMDDRNAIATVWRLLRDKQPEEEFQIHLGSDGDISVLPDGRLLTLNEQLMQSGNRAMRIREWQSNDDAWLVSETIVQGFHDNYSPWVRRDGSIIVNGHDGDAIVYDGEPVA